MPEIEKIPEGYMQNAQGYLVPLDLVTEHDKLRNKLVTDIVASAKEVNSMLKSLKLDSFSDIETFIELAAAEYDVQIGGKKGNLTLMSFDGRYKVVRAMADILTFDERIQVAKELIDSCLEEWTAESRPEVKALVNDAFKVDRQGNISVPEVLKLRKYAIDDHRWQKAMLIIGDSLTVAGAKSYVRVYERDEEDRWKPIPLDVANV